MNLRTVLRSARLMNVITGNAQWSTEGPRRPLRGLCGRAQPLREGQSLRERGRAGERTKGDRGTGDDAPAGLTVPVGDDAWLIQAVLATEAGHKSKGGSSCGVCRSTVLRAWGRVYATTQAATRWRGYCVHVGARLTWVQSLAQEVTSHQPLASLVSGSVSLSTNREFELFLPRRLVGGA